MILSLTLTGQGIVYEILSQFLTQRTLTAYTTDSDLANDFRRKPLLIQLQLIEYGPMFASNENPVVFSVKGNAVKHVFRVIR